MDRPVKRYRISEKIYPEQLPLIEYPSSMEVRKVQQGGLIFFKGKTYRVGGAFQGDSIGILIEENDLASIYYCQQKVMKLDLNNYCN